ncbi:peptidoglycan-binding protein [Streptomyces tendae]|uniref:peptidoglycan-binding protein n=1 Tax=Streptomyces tendae TaxID=1932 RepID=UPI003687D438
MSTGPQRYPGASTAYWYQNRFGGDLQEVNVVVLHTTEGRNLPSYDGGASAPNFTLVPDFKAKRLKAYQHFDFDRSSRALVNLRGGVETNTCNVSQVELVGTCDPTTHEQWKKAGYAYIYWPEAPEWALQGVADLLAWAHQSHGVPLSGPKAWKAYPASYGSGNGVRMSFAQWNSFKGVCGHQHVSENLHGDPGALDFARILELAKQGGATQPAHPTYEPFPGASFFMKGSKPALGKSSPVFTAMGKRLVAEGCGLYRVGPGPVLGQADVASYEKFQRKLGFTGSDAKWPPGPTSWAKLKVPKV